MVKMSLEEKGSKYIEDVLRYSSELLDKSDVSGLSTRDILGFEPPKGANVFLPYIKCVPITTLLPLYDTLIVGIPKIEKVSRIQDATGLTFDNIVMLAQKGKLVLLLNVDCVECLKEMSSVVQQFVDNNVPLFFAGHQETLLALKAAESVGIDFQEGKKIIGQYSELIEDQKTKELRKKLHAFAKRVHQPPPEVYESTYPMQSCSRIKPTAEYLRQVIEIGQRGESPEYLQALVGRLFMIPKLLMARMFHSTLSTNITCRHLHEIEKDFGKSLKPKSPHYFDPTKLEFIEKRLQIAYSEDIPLDEYAEIFDSKTTSAVRKTITTIMSETASRKSFIALQNSITDYNQQISELARRKSKRAKIVYAISDILRSNAEAIKMLLMGAAEKYLNVSQKAWDCIVLPKRYRRSVSSWLEQKTVGVESRLADVSPDVLHLYRVRTCVEKLKKMPQDAHIQQKKA